MARMFLGEVCLQMECRARQRRARKDPVPNSHHSEVGSIFFATTLPNFSPNSVHDKIKKGHHYWCNWDPSNQSTAIQSLQSESPNHLIRLLNRWMYHYLLEGPACIAYNSNLISSKVYIAFLPNGQYFLADLKTIIFRLLLLCFFFYCICTSLIVADLESLSATYHTAITLAGLMCLYL
jgi:hypothetical protein